MNFPIVFSVVILCGVLSSVAGRAMMPAWTLKIDEENLIIRESISKSPDEAEGPVNGRQVVVCNGKTVTIECELDPSSKQTNYANLTIEMKQWTFGYMQMKLIEQTNQNMKISHTFDVSVLKLGQLNNIQCIATYSVPPSSLIRLYSVKIELINFNCIKNVRQQNPRIYRKPAGRKIDIFCSTDNFRDYEAKDNMVWFLDGKYLVPTQSSDVLTLTDLSIADNGLYQCAAMSSTNTTLLLTESYVQVLQKPEPFENFTVTQTDDSSATVSWAPRMIKRPNRMGVMHYLEPRPEKYTLGCYTNDSGGVIQIYNKTVEVVENENETMSRIDLTNLRPYIVYRCQVTWWNGLKEYGEKEISFKILTTVNNNNSNEVQDEASNMIKARIGQSIILDCLKNLPDRQFNKIQWKYKSDSDQDRHHTRADDPYAYQNSYGYQNPEDRIPYQTPEDGLPIPDNDQRIQQQNGNMIFEAHMPSDAGNYTCYVNRSSSPMQHSEKFQIATFTGELTLVIRNLRCGNYTRYSLEIEWEKLWKIGGVKTYKILVWNRRHSKGQMPRVIGFPGNTTNAKIDGLNPESMYRIIVVSISNDNKYSEPAKISCMTDTDD